MFNRYPYTNFHELNLDYFIQHFNEIFTEWEQLYNQLTSWKTDTTEELEQWRAEVETDLDEREVALRAELEIWKQDTADDISDWETATLNALDAWKTAATAQFEAIRVQAAASAEAAAASQTAAASAAAAALLSETAAEEAAAAIQASAAQIATNTDDISELKTQINKITDLFSDDSALLSNALTDNTGTTAGITWSKTGNVLTAQGTSTGNNLIAWVPGSTTFPTDITPGKTYILKVGTTGTGLNLQIAYKVISSDSWTAIAWVHETGEYAFTIPSNATYFRVATILYNGDVLDGTLTAEISNAVTYKDIEEKAVVMRGDVTGLGYTSLAQCNLPGIYTWSTAQITNITDMPSQVTVGGFLRVYKSNNRLWQEIVNNDTHLIRYNTTGRWNDCNDYIVITYDGISGTDSATERVYIDIPNKGSKGSFIRYDFAHCVDASINCDVWRIAYLYYINSSGVSDVMTRRGEFECALHLANRSDFSGGYVHGDEVCDKVYFFEDGQRISDLAANLRPTCKEFKVVRHSFLYDPNDSTTQIAEHGVEYVFTHNDVNIKQSIKWLGDYTLTNCYLAMLPILKTYSTYRYDDVTFEMKSNNQTNYGIWINNAKMVCEWNPTVNSSIEITEYPTGLPGGDRAYITDNSGESYNKVYFVVCNSGTVTEGTLWKSETVYKIS